MDGNQAEFRTEITELYHVGITFRSRPLLAKIVASCFRVFHRHHHHRNRTTTNQPFSSVSSIFTMNDPSYQELAREFGLDDEEIEEFTDEFADAPGLDMELVSALVFRTSFNLYSRSNSSLKSSEGLEGDF